MVRRTNEVIFGSGNANGSFTVDRTNGIELGIRGKLRFGANNLPENVFNSQGNGTYSFSAGTPVIPGPNLPGWASMTTPIWNFEWSINSNFDGSTANNLNDYDYLLEIDFDPGVGVTNFLSFDPINLAFADHSIGTNATASGAGVEAINPADYLMLIGANNLAQNSWNMEFFNDSPFDTFDPNAVGEYTIQLTAFPNGGGSALASVSVIISVPEARAWLSGLLVCGVFGGVVAYRRWFAAQPAAQV
jgi:hypothetical protein